MRVILPSKGHVGVGDVYDAVVGNGDAVSIAGEILQHMFGPAERGLCVNHPILSKQTPQERHEGLRVGQGKTFSVEGQSASLASTSQSSHELPTKNPAEHLHR